LIDRPQGGERAVLVHLQLPLRDPQATADFQEFQELAISAGAEIVGAALCSRDAPDARYFVGTGKLEEIRNLVIEQSAELVLFDHPLSPAQERNLERALKCRVVDRIGLILHIFATRARTYEGKLQVELAQLKHHSTRLVRGWTHLERQKGGIGLRGGPGETQLEVDRRLIRAKIRSITTRLEKVRAQRKQGRRARDRAHLFTVSLVGYTNAGKSTLFNALTGAGTSVADKLFETLDPTLRSLELPVIGKVILADTVGFISKLPHELVEAFRATLEEVQDADLLLHVIDAHAHETCPAHIQQVEEVLAQIDSLAVPRIEVYNKIDLLQGVEPHIEPGTSGVAWRVFVSARAEQGLLLIQEAIIKCLASDLVEGSIHLTPEQGRIRARLYEMNVVSRETPDETGGSVLKVAIPQQRWLRLCHDYPSLKAVGALSNGLE